MQVLKKVVVLLMLLSLSFISSKAQNIHVDEDFNLSVLPSNWTANAITGTQTFVLGLDGDAGVVGNQNINGTAMVFFDDDGIGSAFINNTVSLTTPLFNNSLDSVTFLEFRYNFRALSTNPFDNFKVEVYNGVAWNQVMIVQMDDCGGYTQTNCTNNGFPSARIDISQYKNANCQVRFIYDDGDDWSWYVAIDDVLIYSETAFDLKVNDIKSLSNLNLCNSDTSQLNIEIENIGFYSLDSIIVSYQVNNSSFIKDTIFTAIPSKSKINYVTKSKFPFILGSNSINVFIEQKQDTINSNDSLLNYFYSHAVFPNQFPFTRPFPYLENFDSFTPGTGFWNDGDTLRNRWRRSSSTNVDYTWRVTDIASPSTNTGPTNDLTGMNYLYTEASRGVIDDIATLSSPCFHNPIDSLVGLVFYTHRYGIGDSRMVVELTNGPRKYTLDTLDSFQTSISEDWTRHRYVLANSPSERSSLVFTGIRGNSVRGDFAIDDIKFYPFSEQDVEVKNLLSPLSDCSLSASEQITIEIENIGTKTVGSNTVTASYQVDNGALVSQIVNDSILADSSVIFTFTQRANLSGLNGSYEIKIILNSVPDFNYTNDTSSFSVDNLSINLPYANDFENIVLDVCQADGNPTFTITDPALPFDWSDTSVSWAVQNTSLCNFNAVQGATSTDSTGPSSAYSGTNFLYQEASGTITGPRVLRTSCFNFKNETEVRLAFSYHMYGRRMGNLYIEVERLNNSIVVVDSIIGQNHISSTTPWLLKTVSLNAFAGEVVRLRFRADIPPIINSLPMSDIAIDSLVIYNPLTVATEENSIETSLSIYPNPNNGFFSIQAPKEMLSKRYFILNTKGQLVEEGIIDKTLKEINMSKKHKGVYFIRIEGSVRSFKFIVF